MLSLMRQNSLQTKPLGACLVGLITHTKTSLLTKFGVNSLALSFQFFFSRVQRGTGPAPAVVRKSGPSVIVLGLPSVLPIPITFKNCDPISEPSKFFHRTVNAGAMLSANLGNGVPTEEDELLVEEKNGVGIVTLNRPKKLNCITLPMIEKMIAVYKAWEETGSIKLIILKGVGRVFCAGGDLRMFYNLGKSDEGWKEVVYVKYWFDYHLSTFRKPLVGILHGLVMGGGAGLTVLGQFRVATERTIFAMPEAALGFHTDCGASYWLSHLEGSLGEYLAVLGARIDGAEMYNCGLATHYVSFEKLPQLEQKLLELDSGDSDIVDAAIKEFTIPTNIGPNSIVAKERLALINRTFSKDSIEEILEALEAEFKEPGQEWLAEPIKILRRSSPTGLKVTLKSIRDGRNQTLPEALQREYRLTINTLRAVISDDLYEGIRAVVVEKDNAPKWKPATLHEVNKENLERMVHMFREEEDLVLPSDDKIPRWGGSWKDTNSCHNVERNP